MDDKNLMENILLLEKGVCDLYMHGTLESSTANIHQAFSTALQDSLTMQDTLYSTMAAKGWYPSEQGKQNQCCKTKIQHTVKKESQHRPSTRKDTWPVLFACGE